jgi:hypothetical protein
MSRRRISFGHRKWYEITVAPDDFKIDFHPYQFREMDIATAGKYTASLIKQKHDNVWIALSGGYDSEFVANCFYDNGIAFTPVIWRVKEWPESDYALHWCRERNITPHIVEKKILSSVTLDLLQKISRRMHNDNFLCTMNVFLSKVAEKHGGVLVTGTGGATPDPIFPAAMGEYSEFAEHDFFVEMWNDIHPGAFLTYTVELFYALLKKTDPHLPTQECKQKMYGINFRPKIKPYHLLEKIRNDFEHRNIMDSTKTFRYLIELLEKSLITSSHEDPIPDRKE